MGPGVYSGDAEQVYEGDEWISEDHLRTSAGRGTYGSLDDFEIDDDDSEPMASQMFRSLPPAPPWSLS